MSGARRVVLVSCLAVTGLLVLAAVAALITLRSDWFRERVKARIVREVEEATGGRAEIGAFAFDWQNLRADVSPFVLHGRENPGEAPLFQARSVSVGLKIVSVFERKIDVALLRLEQPRLRIAVYADGRTNLPQPKIARRRHKSAVEQMLDLAIGKFQVEDGIVEIASRRMPLTLEGEELQAQFSYHALKPRYAGQLSFQKLTLEAPSTLPVAVDLKSLVSITGDQIEFSDARISTGRSSLLADGTIRNLASPRLELNYRSDLSLEELGKVLKVPGAPAGRMTLEGRASYAGPSSFELAGRLTGEDLRLTYSRARLRGLRLASELRLSPANLLLHGFTLSAFGGTVRGNAKLDASRRFRVEGDLKDLSVEGLSRALQVEAATWSGRVSGPLTLEGQLAGFRARGLKLSGRLAVVAETGDLPVQGSLSLDYDQNAGVLNLGNSYLSTPSSRVGFEGVLGRRLRVALESKNLRDFLPVVAAFGAKAPKSLPLSLDGGVATFDGFVEGPLESPGVSGRAAITKFVFKGHRFDRLAGEVTLSGRGAGVQGLQLARGSMNLTGQGRAELENWRLADTSKLQGSFSLRGVKLEEVLPQLGIKVPAAGGVSGPLTLSGTVAKPEVAGQISINQPRFYGQESDRAELQVRYTGQSLEVNSARFTLGAAVLQAKGAFTPSSQDWRNGSVRFEASCNGLSLSQVRNLTKASGLDGALTAGVHGELAVAPDKLLLRSLDGNMQIHGIQLDGKPAGDLDLFAETKAGAVQLLAKGEIADAKISGHAGWRLDGDREAQGEVRFTRLAIASLRPWWTPSAGGAKLPLEGFADGKVAFSGQGLDPEKWKAHVELTALEIKPDQSSTEVEAFSVVNNGPIVLDVDRKGIHIQRAQVVGKETDLEATGTIAFREDNTYQLRLQGGVNLVALHGLDEDLTASGNATIDATVRGRMSNPEIYGRLEFKSASFYLSDLPNGIDSASGVILFSRDRATIEKLTAETGGGKLTLGGFVGFGGDQVVYRLSADAAQVRVRYPEGVSTTLNASLRLTGTSINSTLTGNVTILRAGISPRVDFASLLARSSKPLVTPAVQNRLLRGMLFDVRIQTATNARLETTLTEDLQAEADLRLRGTAYKPALLGRLSVTQGEVNFFGTRYTINRGDVSFYNPVKLEPVLNLDLGTRVMGTVVNITFAGPLDKLNVTYRSDPPLQPNEIIALLAVGRAPSTDPTVSARQAELDQTSLGQIGATSLIGQALSAPVTGRLQRFFGVSRIRIDPRLTGIENNPQTQLTLEQQVSKDVTFTYITNLSKTQEQVVRVEWNVNRQWSILAVRDENGLFGVDILFRKQFK